VVVVWLTQAASENSASTPEVPLTLHRLRIHRV